MLEGIQVKGESCRWQGQLFTDLPGSQAILADLNQ